MTQYGIFNGQNLLKLTNATSQAGAVGIYVKRIMRLEYEMKENENGKIVNPENLQACYEDWADTAIENMQNDGYEAGTYIIAMEDMIDNWSNRSWVVELTEGAEAWSGIGNENQYKLIVALFKKHGVVEKEYSITGTN